MNPLFRVFTAGLAFILLAGAMIALAGCASTGTTKTATSKEAPATNGPPELQGTFGIVQCGQPLVIWVIVKKNGHIVRFDHTHPPVGLFDDEQKFFAWLNSVPGDQVVIPCDKDAADDGEQRPHGDPAQPHHYVDPT